MLGETAVEYLSTDATLWFTSNEKKWITKIMRLKESHPELVEILREPSENGGYLYARLPKDWLRVAPPRSLSLTDEERRVRAERMRDARMFV